MTNKFLSFTIAGVLFTANGYANTLQSVLVYYTCPDTCTITNDVKLTDVGCVDSDEKDCGTPVAKILEFTPIPEKTIEKVDKTSNEKSKSVATRAAKKQNTKTNTIKPASGTPEKSMSGVVNVTCPDGCKFKCDSNSTGAWCWCEDTNGKHCGEQTVSTGTLDK